MAAFPQPPLLAISQRKATSLPLALAARALFSAGVRWFSLREPDLDPVRRMMLLRSLLTTAQEFGATVGVHHDLAAALATKAAAFHLSTAQLLAGEAQAARGALSGRVLLGASCHNLLEIRAAEKAGVDYITLSPVFASLSKAAAGMGAESHAQLGAGSQAPMGAGSHAAQAPMGVAGFAALAAETKLPVLALSGITPLHAAECLAAGAAGVAVMGGLMAASDPAAEADSYLAVVRAKTSLQMI